MKGVTIRMYLGVAVVVHVVAVLVAVHSANVARSYWGQFLQGIPFPTLFLFVLDTARWLPILAVVVLLAAVLVGFKATERTMLHFLVGVMTLSIAILSVTAIGLGNPMSVTTRIMEQKSANQASDANGIEATPQHQR